MFIGSVIHYQVHNQFHSSFMNPFKHGTEIFQCAEFIHNISVIRNIISIIIIWRFVTGREPDHVNAQLFQIIQFADDSGKIPDSIPVRIHKTSWVYLIYHRFFPPGFFHNCSFSFLFFSHQNSCFYFILLLHHLQYLRQFVFGTKEQSEA